MEKNNTQIYYSEKKKRKRKNKSYHQTRKTERKKTNQSRRRTRKKNNSYLQQARVYTFHIEILRNLVCWLSNSENFHDTQAAFFSASDRTSAVATSKQRILESNWSRYMLWNYIDRITKSNCVQNSVGVIRQAASMPNRFGDGLLQ